MLTSHAEQIKAIQSSSQTATAGEEGPRIFALHRYDDIPLQTVAHWDPLPSVLCFAVVLLSNIAATHRNFYQMRLDRLKNIETAKRNQQRLKDPSFFPAAPKGDLG